MNTQKLLEGSNETNWPQLPERTSRSVSDLRDKFGPEMKNLVPQMEGYEGARSLYGPLPSPQHFNTPVETNSSASYPELSHATVSPKPREWLAWDDTKNSALAGATIGTVGSTVVAAGALGGGAGGVVGGMLGFGLGAASESPIIAGASTLLGGVGGAAGGAALATGISVLPLGIGAGIGAILSPKHRLRGAAIGTLVSGTVPALLASTSVASAAATLGGSALFLGGAALAGVGLKAVGDWSCRKRGVQPGGTVRQIFRGITAPLALPIHAVTRVARAVIS